MKIESFNNQYIQQNINKSVNHQNNIKEEAIQNKSASVKDTLELSDAIQKMDLIKDRISLGYYDQKEILQNVANKLYNDIKQNNNIEYTI